MSSKLSNDLIYRLSLLKEKLGTWRETADVLGVSPRTLRRWRKGTVQSTNKDIDEIKDRLDYASDKYSKTDIYEQEEIKAKYNLPQYMREDYIKTQDDKKVLITLHKHDFAYRDSLGRWRVGEFAENVDRNYKGKRGRLIKYKEAKKLMNKGKKQIQLVNKARHFHSQKELDYQESFSLARDWQREYIKEKRDFMEHRQELYYQKSGLRLGTTGAEILNDYYDTDKYHKGQRLSEDNRQIIESKLEIPYGDLEGLNMYVDGLFELKPSE